MASAYALESYPKLFSQYPFLTEKLEFPLPTPYQEFINLSQYSRHIPGLDRRETYHEEIFRFLDFIVWQCQQYLFELSDDDINNIFNYMSDLQVFPSMRLLWSAGDSVKKNASANYNCCYTPIDSLKAFTELMYLSMSGCGVGFSVEHQYVRQLPMIPNLQDVDYVIKIEDSREGWVRAYGKLLKMLSEGYIPKYDMSNIRPQGERLKTSGGYSSGPRPLINLFDFTIKKFEDNQLRHLTTLDCHDICCMCGEISVSGAMRRAALISYSDIDDYDIRGCKSGEWWKEYPYRALANNSAVHPAETSGLFWEEWKALRESGSGERGIFGEKAVQKKVRSLVRRDTNWDHRGNPCQEIILRPKQMCNLSNVIIRPYDTIHSLEKKIRIATILGTIQSTITHFDTTMLSSQWIRNCEDERLLGVSLSGIADHPMLFNNQALVSQILDTLKNSAISVNQEYAEKLGIHQSAAITTIKPSGDSSQLANCSSGIHPRHSPYYIRRVRLQEADPLAQWMMNFYPYEKDVYTESSVVFSFPIKSPEDTTYQSDISAIQHAEIWRRYKEDWTEHTVSATISVKDEEWDDLGWWVKNNLDDISGLSFLPKDNHTYQQAPYEELTEQEYYDMKETMPEIDWRTYTEKNDNTSEKIQLVCTGDKCEL